LGTGNQGFLYDAGIFTTIDVPGSTGTEAYAINNIGQIVGNYTDSQGLQHGFLYSGGTFTTINVPGADWTDILGINDLGQIVGDFTNNDNKPGARGFVDTGGIFTEIDIMNSYYTTVTGINDAGVLTGEFLPCGADGNSEGCYTFTNIAILNAETPLPAALPLFGISLGVMGLFGCRKKQKTA